MDISEICEGIKAAITEIEVEGITGAGKPLTWEATGEVSKAPAAVKIENGVYVGME